MRLYLRVGEYEIESAVVYFIVIFLSRKSSRKVQSNSNVSRHIHSSTIPLNFNCNLATETWIPRDNSPSSPVHYVISSVRKSRLSIKRLCGACTLWEACFCGFIQNGWGEGKSIDRLGKDGRQSASFVWNETAVLLKGFDPCVKIWVETQRVRLQVVLLTRMRMLIALLLAWFVRGRSLIR